MESHTQAAPARQVSLSDVKNNGEVGGVLVQEINVSRAESAGLPAKSRGVERQPRVLLCSRCQALIPEAGGGSNLVRKGKCMRISCGVPCRGKKSPTYRAWLSWRACDGGMVH